MSSSHVIHLISLPSFAPLIVSPLVSHPLPFFLPLHLFHHCLPRFLSLSLSFLLSLFFSSLTFSRSYAIFRSFAGHLRACALALSFSLSEPAKLLMIPRTWNLRNHEVLRRSPVFVRPLGLAVSCGTWSCGRGSQHHSCCNTTLNVARAIWALRARNDSASVFFMYGSLVWLSSVPLQRRTLRVNKNAAQDLWGQLGALHGRSSNAVSVRVHHPDIARTVKSVNGML